MSWGERPSRRLPWAAVVVFIAVGARAGAAETELVRQIFAALDVGAEVAAIAPIASAQFAHAPPADRLLLRHIVESGFAARRLEGLAFEAFRAQLDLTRAHEATRWLARPEIQRVYAAGRAPARRCDGEERGMGARARALRIAAARSLEERVRRHATRVFGAMLHTANAALPETHRYSPLELAELIAAHRASLPANVAAGCCYRELPTDWLLAAQAFLESEAGHWLHESVSAAVEQALDRAARATALRIVETFGGADSRDSLRIAWTPGRGQAAGARDRRGSNGPGQGQRPRG